MNLPKVLYNDCIEQAMRCTANEFIVAGIASSLETNKGVNAAVGRLLVKENVHLLNGSPLVTIIQNRLNVDVNWRKNCTPLHESLYAQLLWFRQLDVSSKDIVWTASQDVDCFTEWCSRVNYLRTTDIRPA